MPRKHFWKKSASKKEQLQVLTNLTDMTEDPGLVKKRTDDINSSNMTEDPGLLQNRTEDEGAVLIKNSSKSDETAYSLAYSFACGLRDEFPDATAYKPTNGSTNGGCVNDFVTACLEKDSALASTSKDVFSFGSFHQGNSKFSQESRGRQCTCTSLMMLTYIQKNSNFSPEVLDGVLTEGDALYRLHIQKLQRNGKFQHHLLTFNELPDVVTYKDDLYRVHKYNMLTGTVLESESFGSCTLQHNLCRSLQISDTILLMVGAICSAVFKMNSQYYFYDSHSHDANGMSGTDSGRAIFAAFKSIDELLLYLYAYYQSLNLLETNLFEIQPVQFLPFGRNIQVSTKCDDLLSNYFHYQQTQQSNMDTAKKNKITGQEKKERENRKEYMRRYLKNYMQTKRQDPKRRQPERQRNKKAKKKSRENNEKRQLERETNTKAMKQGRQNPEKREAERIRNKEAKKQAREDPEKRELETTRNKEAKKQARGDPEKREIEKTRNKEAMKQAREDPEKRELEKTRNKDAMKQARGDPEKRKLEKTRNKEAMKQAREDPEKRELEKTRNKEAMKQAREDPEKRELERTRNKEAMKQARGDPEKRKLEKTRNKEAMKQAREDPEKRELEKTRNKEAMKQAREDPEKRELERTRNKEAMKQAREDPEKRELERQTDKKSKKQAREKPEKREYEKERDRTSRALKRKNKDDDEHEDVLRKRRRHGSSLNECIIKFHETISKGPVYVCSCCRQTWFQHSVTNLQQLRSSKESVENFLTDYVSVDKTEWICQTCLVSIKANRIPKLSVFNKMVFPTKPPELNLHQLEERLVALRIPFMQIRELPRGGQLSIKGNVVNVPVDIQPVVDALPRKFDESITVPVKLKKKLSYKKCDFTENVRPVAVISALHWLMNNSELYKNSGITIDKDWVEKLNLSAEESVQEFIKDGSSSSDTNEINIAEESGDVYDSDHFSEIDEQDKNVGNMDTLLDDANPFSDATYTFAPGEGQKPLSLYQDPDAEYLAFPTIFCGQRRASKDDRKTDVNYSDIVKWELRNVDRRAAKNVPNIFFKMKKIQMKQVTDKVAFAVRRLKGNRKKITAEQALDPEVVKNFVRLDEGYHIFRTLRNSPPYLEAKKKEVFAMIRQLGLPTWFGSFSSADTRWIDLLKILVQLNERKIISDEDAESMSWSRRTKLVQQDPVTCVRYFDHRVQEFIKTVLKSDHQPIGKLQDFFYRVEFQQRGSPHIHMLIWIEGAPKYGENPTEEITLFIDQYVSCSVDVEESLKQLIEFQTHKHSKSCRKKGKPVCRFGFPLPPMPRTMILKPLKQEVAKYKKLYAEIQNRIANEKEGMAMSYEQFLKMIKIKEDDYLKAIRSSLDSPKVFLKRDPMEIRVNAYIKTLLQAWKANHDLQFVIDAFACAVYIVSYISKSQRGMSMLLHQASKEARQGNMDLKQQVRHIGNHFLNSVEVSGQEAACMNLQIPLTKSSRGCKFINTSNEDERTFVLKSKQALQKLPTGSTDIEANNDVKRYPRRPKQLENWCLADYVSRLDVTFPDKEDYSVSNLDEHEDEMHSSDDEMNESFSSERLSITTKGGIKIREKETPTIIRYVNYNRKVDPENYFRERLMLYLPWRSEKQIKCPYHTYEEHYNENRTVIQNKQKEYEHNVEELLKAMEMANDESLNYDQIAPGAEQVEQDDIMEGSKESKSFIYFNPDRPSIHKNYDIGFDIGLSAKSVDIEPHTILTEDYLEMVRTLNVKQKEFFLHVLHWIKTKNEALFIFLTGGAGVGKSVVVRALYQALTRYLASDSGEDPEDCRVLICAPTGSAAYNVDGYTIHGALKLWCRHLTADNLNTLRTKFRNLKVILIDEVSMISNKMLDDINTRLQEIKGSNAFFGGVSIVVIGDLYQLKPPGKGNPPWIFEDKKSGMGPLATNLWKELFTMHELTEIMIQKDDAEFSRLLNRLREGKQTSEDIQKLKTRMTDSTRPDYPKEAPHLFVTNANVDRFNQSIFDTAVAEKVTIHSLDDVLGEMQQCVKDNLIQSLPDKEDITGGLSRLINIAQGLVYDISANLDVTDGLTNGTSCHVQYIERRQQNTMRPSIIWVLFSDHRIGKQRRLKYKHLYHEGIDNSWTPICNIKRTFVHNRCTFVRVQFPLRLAAAKTIHKAQGSTLDSVVVDMSMKKHFRGFPHSHYVAFSRVRSLGGLHILTLQEDKICRDEKVDEEMTRLRRESILQLCYMPLYAIEDDRMKVAFHNTRSLHCHVEDVKAEKNLRDADIFSLCETWLCKADADEQYQIEGFSMYRKDGFRNDTHARPHRGMILYVKNSVSVIDVHYFTSNVMELIAAKFSIGEQSLQLLTLYRASQCTFSDFSTLLIKECENFFELDKSIVITGDINSDVLTEKMYMQFIEKQFQCAQVLCGTTHDCGSLLDHIYTNVIDVIADTIEAVWSDHKIVYAAIKLE